MDYFARVASNDWWHLCEQLNSVDNEKDAREKYLYWSVLDVLIPRFVPRYDKGPFKLICDDFGRANMIVNSAEDLEIVAVIDWEWSYAGPLQLFWSPPRWLLIQTPNTWSESDERLTNTTDIWTYTCRSWKKRRTRTGTTYPLKTDHRL